MARLTYYAVVSTGLAAGVVISAFHQRANFYSACVYLSQSNLCLMILINLILFIYGSFMYALQRLCYGALRPIETEQLYEKAWFAITETCLAMTIFRDEVGAWFLVMFVALLTGKVWGWIGEGRVEVLEQQPPANPRLFHIRLSISLAMSVVYNLWLMNHTVNAVIQQARPNMMVMFLFEFAILTTSCFATAFRYCISVVEARVVKRQTEERLQERRREVREQRAEMIRQREAAAATAGEGDVAQPSAPLPSEDDVDEMDIEVPGWESKGQWVLTLDLLTDLTKFLIYITFFLILLMFYGLPIHIIHNLFLTARSFMKRLAAFIKYRRATHDMNARYQDATVEDIQREDTCIICREEMRPWSVTNPQAPPPAAPGAIPPARPSTTVNERSRPKKLPCGHILHLGCLKSWLERQQVCPTCRRPVVDPPPIHGRGAANNANPAVQGAQPAQPGQPNAAGAQPPAAPRAGRGMRMLNFGPLRVGFGQANLQDLARGLGGAPDGQGQENGGAGGPRVYGLEVGFPRQRQPQPPAAQGTANATNGTTSLQEQVQQIEQQIVAEIRALQLTQQELQLVQLLQTELTRLRLIRNGGADPLAANFQMPQIPQLGSFAPLPRHPSPFPSQSSMQRHGTRSNASAIPSGSADLPPGVTIPEGWSLLPLERLDGPPRADGPSRSETAAGVAQPSNVPVPGPSTNGGVIAPTATTTSAPSVISPMTSSTSNNTNLTPTPMINPENDSQASSVNSSDTNAIHTPPSLTADQSAPSISSPTVPSSTAGESSLPDASNPVPNWGRPSSQLFSGPRAPPPQANTMDTSVVAVPAATRTSPPQSAERRSAEPAALSPRSMDEDEVENGDEAEEESSEEEEEEEEEEESESESETDRRRKEKGKAKQVTVEDAEDEAEGL